MNVAVVQSFEHTDNILPDPLPAMVSPGNPVAIPLPPTIPVPLQLSSPIPLPPPSVPVAPRLFLPPVSSSQSVSSPALVPIPLELLLLPMPPLPAFYPPLSYPLLPFASTPIIPQVFGPYLSHTKPTVQDHNVLDNSSLVVHPIPSDIPAEIQVLMDAYVNNSPILGIVSWEMIHDLWDIHLGSKLAYGFLGRMYNTSQMLGGYSSCKEVKATPLATIGMDMMVIFYLWFCQSTLHHGGLIHIW
ncbi:hypothetical protein VKT23_012132 [Stygiomarasmius scandens]|uniref:Uncharacterized protein n=1 Tax=Marasmiellus scandens TaxID=2682957 RepID=A0ABR1J706_9AGAR